jgi:drug/metabolite transporter (DMT)-like permease
MNSWVLLFPLAAALGYALSALCLKRAMEEGAGVLRTGFVTNVMMGILFFPILLFAEGPLVEENWYAPLITAVFFFLGQIFTFLALRKGDVSVATPLMGSKVIFVAAISVILLPEPVPIAWWIAAMLAFWSVWLLRVGRPADKRRLVVSITFALLSAASFAVCDVLVQRFGAEWGFQRFVPLAFGLVAVFAVGFVPFFRDPLQTMTRAAWRWLVPGAVLLSLQALCIAYALSTYGSATAVNVVYSLRGIMSIVLVISVGSFFGNVEGSAGSAVMTRRLISGALIFIAVLLVLVG